MKEMLDLPLRAARCMVPPKNRSQGEREHLKPRLEPLLLVQSSDHLADTERVDWPAPQVALQLLQSQSQVLNFTADCHRVLLGVKRQNVDVSTRERLLGEL